MTNVEFTYNGKTSIKQDERDVFEVLKAFCKWKDKKFADDKNSE